MPCSNPDMYLRFFEEKENMVNNCIEDFPDINRIKRKDEDGKPINTIVESQVWNKDTIIGREEDKEDEDDTTPVTPVLFCCELSNCDVTGCLLVECKLTNCKLYECVMYMCRLEDGTKADECIVANGRISDDAKAFDCNLTGVCVNGNKGTKLYDCLGYECRLYACTVGGEESSFVQSKIDDAVVLEEDLDKKKVFEAEK